MMGMNPRSDHTGGIESDYHNFNPNMDETQKYILEIEADRTMDFFIMINPSPIISLILDTQKVISSYYSNMA
jgi:hypothetical protein